MLQFDTLKIIFPSVIISSLNTEKLIEFKDFKGKNTYYQNYRKIPNRGLIYIRIGNTTTTIEFSAKVLNENYPNLISSDTIEEALFNLLNASPCIFDVHQVLNLAQVIKAHPAKLISLKKSFSSYTTPLAQFHVSRDYQTELYEKETLTYIQNKKTKAIENISNCMINH